MIVKTTALRETSLDIAPGEFVALIGASGSGKSTLLNIIGALDRPSRGQVWIMGKCLDEMSDNELSDFRNKTIGFIFQFHYLLPEFSVLENVMIPHLIRFGTADEEAYLRARDLLQMVGMEHRVSNRANAISGGEQQRVAIARALMNNPPVILADEPTGNLDSLSSERVFQLLRTINQEMGTAFIIVTHNRSLAARADRLLEIRDGQLWKDLVIKGMLEDEIWSDLPKECY